LKAGAAGYLLKGSDGHEIIKALHEVVGGGSMLSSSVAGLLT
jgi:DNA-binding NarL/FixJ family response regulator